MIVLMYGEQLETGGAYDHPNGQTCALTVHSVWEFEDPEEAIEEGIAFEAQRDIHSVVLETEQ
jgi:hypothetical protein